MSTTWVACGVLVSRPETPFLSPALASQRPAVDAQSMEAFGESSHMSTGLCRVDCGVGRLLARRRERLIICFETEALSKDSHASWNKPKLTCRQLGIPDPPSAGASVDKRI